MRIAMSAGSGRPSRRRAVNAAAISAVAQAGVRGAWGHSLGVNLHFGADRVCRVLEPSGGAAAQGA